MVMGKEGKIYLNTLILCNWKAFDYDLVLPDY